jgi:hypothetical protein
VNATSVCASGACQLLTCASGFDDCDGVPTNGCEAHTDDDASQCDSCGNACPIPANASATCTAGTCGYERDADHLDCESDGSNGCETTPAVNVTSCGACGTSCMAGGECAGGHCGRPLGTTLFAGACVAFNSDPSNCGGCDNACTSGNVCVAGVCKATCPTGSTLCAGSSVLLGVDNDHCGACDTH